MISDLCFEVIEDDFHYAQYGPFKVVMRKSDAFINATHLCKMGGKRFTQWKDNKSSIELVDAVNKEIGEANAVQKSVLKSDLTMIN